MAMRGLGMMGIAAVTILSLATPAQAQRYDRHRHHDHGGGNFILGALLGGALVAIAASDDHKQRERERVETETYEEPADAPPPEATSERTSYAIITDPDRASDACAAAAQDSGQRYARLTSIGAIDGVDKAGETWMVRGTLLLRDDYRQHGTEHGFRCTIAGAGAPNVRIDGYDESQ